ncbi:MAG TPA: lamin tail domain-containing protein, partial [Acidimicrobiia bacterium]|nr:lamin tail domain-containing protein [Acidimicrobiia bacterium]
MTLTLVMVIAIVPTFAAPAVAVSPNVVISEVYGGGGNSGATLTHDFIELYNRGSEAVDLTGWSVQYASAAGTGAWQVTALVGTIQPGGFYLVQEAVGAGGTTPLPTPDATGTTAMSSTAGRVALVNNSTSLGTGVGCPTSTSIVDLLGYGTTAICYEGAPTANTSNTTSAARVNPAIDTDNNSVDFGIGAPTPQNAEQAPLVASTAPADGSAGFAVGGDLSITFSEPVNVSGSWFGIECSGSGAHSATVSGGPSAFTLNPDVDFADGDECTVTVFAAGVTDQDSMDPPDTMEADFVFMFSAGVAPDPCTLAYTPAYAIQGTEEQAAITGSVTTQGVVVGDYEGPSGSTLRGFFIQDPVGDGNAATSDGIFIFEGSGAGLVQLGDVVRVTGTASDFQGQTQVSASSVAACGTGSVEPVDVTLPAADTGYFEQFEGMLVR